LLKQWKLRSSQVSQMIAPQMRDESDVPFLSLCGSLNPWHIVTKWASSNNHAPTEFVERGNGLQGHNSKRSVFLGNDETDVK
jgi:hypothetical protein